MVDQLQAAGPQLRHRARRRGQVALVDHLDRVDHQQRRLQLAGLLGDTRQVCVRQHEQPVGQLPRGLRTPGVAPREPLGPQPQLARGLFAGDVEHRLIPPRQRDGGLQHQRGLADPRVPAQHRRAARHQPATPARRSSFTTPAPPTRSPRRVGPIFLSCTLQLSLERPLHAPARAAQHPVKLPDARGNALPGGVGVLVDLTDRDGPGHLALGGRRGDAAVGVHRRAPARGLDLLQPVPLAALGALAHPPRLHRAAGAADELGAGLGHGPRIPARLATILWR